MTIKATLVFRDSNTYLTRKAFDTKTDVLATAQAAVAGLITDINPLTDLQLLHVVYSFKDATQAFAGELESNVDLGATFIGTTADGDAVVVKVPGFPQSKVGPGGIISLADADVAAFLDNFEGAGQFTISDGESVAEWVKGTRDKG